MVSYPPNLGETKFDFMRRPVRIVAVDSLESLNLINVIIDNTSDFHLVNEYTELDKALKLISRDLPDIFLVDINHRNFRSPVSISSIKAKLPYVEVIALSDEVSDVLVKDCFSNGASGFIEKKSEFTSKLINHLRDVSNGGVAISQSPARKLIESLWINPFSPLSRRERQILKLMSEGCTYTEIGTHLEISSETVKTHIRNIYRKLKVNKKSNALDKARVQRLV